MFNYSRRLNRVSYITGLVLAAIWLIVVDVVQAIIDGANEDFWKKNQVIDFLIGIFILTGLAIFFMYLLGVIRKRANDIGWHPILVTVLVFWNPLMLLLAFIPGLKTRNKFSDIPPPGIHIK